MTLKYAAREWQTIVDEVLAEIAADPTKAAIWTDTTPGSVGRLLLELIAYVGDMMEHSIDYRASELYLLTARLKESVLRIAKSEGYRVRGPNAALCDVTLDFAGAGAPFGVDVTVPAFAKTAGGVDWYYGGGGVLAAGQTTLVVTVTQAVRRTLVSSGTGLSYQRVIVGSAMIPYASIACAVAGVPWTEESPIGLSDYDERTFEAMYDEEQRTVVQFGNRFAGRMPPAGASIELSWLETSGAAGNAGAHVWQDETLSWFATELGVSITVACDNAAAASGGLDYVDWRTVKSLLVPWRRAVDMGVTADAIRALALSFQDPTYGSVAKCTATLVAANTLANAVGIYVASAANPYTLQTCSAGLKAALLDYLNRRKIITVQNWIYDPTFVDVPVTVQVHMVLGAQQADVTAAVTAAIRAVFSVDKVEIGAPIYLSDIYEAIEALEDVEWCIVQAPTGNVVEDAAAGECVRLAAVTVNYV
jgi:hypothetical protein